MARFRAVAAVAILLFGSTFLWFTPSFLGTGATVDRAIWWVIQVLVVATVVGFAGAAWGLYKATAWCGRWRSAGRSSALWCCPLWWITASSIGGVTNMAANLALHAAEIAVVLLVPSLARGLDRRSPSSREARHAPHPHAPDRPGAAVGAAGLLVVYLKPVRPQTMRWRATNEEVARPLPGDDVLARPGFRATRAITIRARPEHIWPWPSAIGSGRAGWYAFDRIDNAGVPSAQRIVPELQDLKVGDLVPMW